MKKVVDRERNKIYYRVLHVPIWIWVFFILPGHLEYALFTTGPDRRHLVWLALVVAACAWRGFKGRLPGVELRPYITHWGVDEPNLPYRVVCYTAAWIDLLVPFTLNFLGLVVASFTGVWVLDKLFLWLYYPLALAVVAATLFDLVPRTKRSTRFEGQERAWFYVAIWTIVFTQLAAWATWRLGRYFELDPLDLARLRLAAFVAVATTFLVGGARGWLGRTDRYYVKEAEAAGDRDSSAGELADTTN